MNNFHVGQKVVCVRDKPWRSSAKCDPLRHRPEKGEVFQIIEIEEHPFYMSGVGLVLAEIGFDEGFCSGSFRPVRTTDISIFTAMLAPTPRIKQPV